MAILLTCEELDKQVFCDVRSDCTSEKTPSCDHHRSAWQFVQHPALACTQPLKLDAYPILSYSQRVFTLFTGVLCRILCFLVPSTSVLPDVFDNKHQCLSKPEMRLHIELFR